LPCASNARLRRAVNARGHFLSTEQAALKCLYLALMSLDPAGKGRKRWTNRWKAALGRPHPGCPSLGTPAGGIDRVIRVRPRWPGAVVAAWPAASLVGSYELLIWMIRTAAACGPDRVPAADQTGPQPDHDGTSLSLVAAGSGSVPASSVARRRTRPCPGGWPAATAPHCGGGPGTRTDPAQGGPGARGSGPPGRSLRSGRRHNAAAVAAYRASVQAGQPLSERKLAQKFGKTSKRWARNRIAEATRPTAAA
jgi:hypothetical protein